MPKVWLAYSEGNDCYYMGPREPVWLPRRVQVEVNNSLYRQICAAAEKYEKFQAAMAHWMTEAEAGRLKRISNGR
jgi:hypothetical protein